MLNVKGIDHINLAVVNLEESIKFYKDIFKFEVKERGVQEAGPWAIIGNGKAYMAIYEGYANEKYEKKGFYHLGFHISDFDRSFNELKEKGIKIWRDEVINHGNSRSMYIEDPNGYEFELSEVFGAGL